MKAVLTAFIIFVLIGSLVVGMRTIETATAQISRDIVINVDGSVTGTDKIKQEDNVYSFISDISGSVGNGAVFINVLKDDIIIDGAGYSLKGTGTGIALQLQGVTNVTVRNVVIDNFGSGIYTGSRRDRESDITSQPSNLKIINNDLKTTYGVISLKGTNNSIISGNTFTSYNKNFGLNLGNCYNNTITNNAFFGGGLSMHYLNQNTFSQNTLNGKALVVLENKSNMIIEGAGQVFLFNCVNMTVRNMEPAVNHRFTVQLIGTNNSQIINCTGTITLTNSSINFIKDNYLPDGLSLDYSHNNTIANNILTNLGPIDTGINLESSHSNIIYGNSIQAKPIGIQTSGSRHNIIAGNNITAKEWGIRITGNSNNIYNNNISNCKIGIILSSNNNTIIRNIVMLSNEIGLLVTMASNNTIYHNNFILNTQQVKEQYWWEYGFQFTPVYSLNNVWDDGEKGNFWSNYYNQDLNGDGIWDESYQMTNNFTDRYPLNEPFNIDTNIPFPIVTPTLAPTPSVTATASPSASPSTSSSTVIPLPTSTPLTPSSTTPEFFVWAIILAAAVTLMSLVIKKKLGVKNKEK